MAANVTTVRVEGLEEVVRTLRALPKELVGKRGGPVRMALRSGARVIMEDMKARLRQIIAEPNVGGRNVSTGLLEKNIQINRGRLRAGTNGEAVIIRVRVKAYPKESTDEKTVTTAQVARLLEYGTAMREQMPFIRPAFDAQKQAALDTFVADMQKRLPKLVRKLAEQNGVKS